MAEIPHAMMILFLTGAVAYLILMMGKVTLAWVYAAGDAPVAEDLESRTLTVIQPILSGDSGLAGMLESNLVSLGGQRFLWLCDEDDGEAISVTDQLIRRYPDHAIEVLRCPACPEGMNPKVFKIIHATERVATPFFLVLDDDTHLPAVTAAALVRHARDHVIATGLPRYRDGGSLPATLLAQFVNNNSAMTYLSLLPVSRPLSINGMCYVMKTADIGIFPGISHHLTDDLALATIVRQRGGSIYQSSHPQWISTQVENPSHYLRMMHRWYLFALLLLKQQTPAYRLAIFLLHGWHPLVLWGLLTMAAFWPYGWMPALLGLILLIRAGLLAGLQLRLFGRVVHRPLASLLSELLQPFHLVHALVDRRIRWRSRRYRVFASDRFQTDE